MKTKMKQRRTYLVDEKTMENIEVIKERGYSVSYLIRKWIYDFVKKLEKGEE
ncbi:MAG: hypothetical protein JRE14_02590 [Deltaproteobacteria bacterium]|nr:hypothetical protein [Deltaproteobacteria bacterium]